MYKVQVDRARPTIRKRLWAAASALAVGATVLVATGPAAGAVEHNVSDATFEWAVSAELQSAAPFGGCNYLSAGRSDGSEASYKTSGGNVAVLKDGVAPTWANKCSGAATGSINQKVRWSGGSGTVDPATGVATIVFTGELSMTFYGGLAPFTVKDPVLTVAAGGRGKVVATVFGYQSSMDNPEVKEPLEPELGVTLADLSGVSLAADGFTVTPDYAGITYDPPAGSGGAPQNRTTPGWGSWPKSFIDYHYLTGLSSYWYHSGSAADPKKAPAPIAVTYLSNDPGAGTPEPGPGQQVITANVPESTGPGEFVWAIDGDGSVNLGSVTDRGGYLQATGAIDPISVTDTRVGGPQWSISGQVSDFNGGISGKHLGWGPQILSAGAGAVAGADVASGINSGGGLSVSSVLAAAPAAHDPGTARVGADLDLRLPVDTAPGTYSAVLTITALA